MAEVFIVRPFGSRRPVLKKNAQNVLQTVYFDFDQVETDLIKPAMYALNLGGGTTGEIFAPGDIREDMFSELLKADIVIADITIHNANVFYELGIRHALRHKTTILIKCPGYDDTPFDIIGYRYLSYDKEDPGAGKDKLIETIKEALDAKERKDSPVFNVLPNLEEQESEKFIALPDDFIKEAEDAVAAKYVGKLRLLADEALSFHWKVPALKMIGAALNSLGVFAETKEIWEAVLKHTPNDLLASERISTVYEKIAAALWSRQEAEASAYLKKSDKAADNVLKHPKAGNNQKAEAQSLIARNYKTRWLRTWNKYETLADRSKNALLSTHLFNAQKNYEKGFQYNLNHYYSGLNALGLLTAIIDLAESNPETWVANHDSDEAADIELDKMKAKKISLSQCVSYALDTEMQREENIDNADNRQWLMVSKADLLLLTSNKKERVVNAYKRLWNDVKLQVRQSALRQIELYHSLGLFNENVTAVLENVAIQDPEKAIRDYYLLFTGHMVDAPTREKPRFPNTPEKIAAVRAAIKATIIREQERLPGGFRLKGIAGGACGGDILFHEICKELGIPTTVFLAIPEDQFKVASVAHGGNEWIRKFEALCSDPQTPVYRLSDSKELPKWLSKKKDYGIWQRNNLWELFFALANGGSNMTLIALWDKQKGDGAGGTEDMVNKVNERGGKVEVVEMGEV